MGVSNSLDPVQNWHSVGPDLGPNCLQKYQQTTKIAASKDRVNPSSANSRTAFPIIAANKGGVTSVFQTKYHAIFFYFFFLI